MPILFFIFFPFLTIIFYSAYIYSLREASGKFLWYIAIMLSLYLGILNSTKELAGDFLEYSLYFYSVPNFSLQSYLLLYGKEPLFYAYTWFSYYLFGGNWNLYVVSLTSINYLIISYCLILIHKRLNSSYRVLIVSLFFMAFFFQEFAAIGNLMRQAISEAFSLLFLVNLYIRNKKCWWIALCALLIHSSCLPIIGVGIIPKMREKFTFNSFLQICLPLALLVAVFAVLGDILTNVPYIGYIFSKADNLNFGQDAWQETVGLQPAMYALIILLIIMAMGLYIIMGKSRCVFTEIGLININIILIILMLICNATGAYYLLTRYFFYIYVFQIPLFLSFFSRFTQFNSNVIHLLMVVLLIVYFFYNYTHNIFSYSSIIEATLGSTTIFFF